MHQEIAPYILMKLWTMTCSICQGPEASFTVRFVLRPTEWHFLVCIPPVWTTDFSERLKILGAPCFATCFFHWWSVSLSLLMESRQVEKHSWYSFSFSDFCPSTSQQQTQGQVCSFSAPLSSPLSWEHSIIHTFTFFPHPYSFSLADPWNRKSNKNLLSTMEFTSSCCERSFHCLASYDTHTKSA